MQKQLNQQIHRAGAWCAIAFILTSVVSLFIPLDAPDAMNIELSERVDWLNENRGTFLAGWVNQMVSMLALSGLLLALAWVAAKQNPLCGLLSAMMTGLATMAFAIPKFMAIWTIPTLAASIESSSVTAAMASQLLLILNVSVPYSLYTSFDYLGFWLYALASILMSWSLYGAHLAEKLTSLTAVAFGVGFHVVLVLFITETISVAELEICFMSVASMILITAIASLKAYFSLFADN